MVVLLLGDQATSDLAAEGATRLQAATSRLALSNALACTNDMAWHGLSLSSVDFQQHRHAVKHFGAVTSGYLKLRGGREPRQNTVLIQQTTHHSLCDIENILLFARLGDVW